MALDGTFVLRSAVARFVARCSCSVFDSIGENASREEILGLAGDVLLHPRCTIPLVGCFRPVLREIVEKAVSSLRLVGDLRLNSGVGDVEVGEQGIAKELESHSGRVVEFYVCKGRGLDLHELACLAFCRVLDLAPFLLGSVLEYFKFAPPPFERIFADVNFLRLSVSDVAHLLRVVQTSYRMLLMSSEVFSKLWDWSCFLDVARYSKNFPVIEESNNNTADILWCSAHILSLTFKVNTEIFGVDAEESFRCLLRWEEFCRDVAFEKAGFYMEMFRQKNLEADGVFDEDNLCESLGLKLWTSYESGSNGIQRILTWDDDVASPPIVLTSSLRKSFEMVKLAISQRWPVLLYGLPGVGKSALIGLLAKDSGNHVLSIHMDDQLDGKTLIGSYVSAEQPGEFRWQPGSLTQAVVNGYWMVFEDIDKAPSDVHAILLPLLEGASSFMTTQGEEVRVAENFRLFSTVSAASQSSLSGSAFPGTLWRRVMIGQPSHDDLISIVKARFPRLESLVERLVETFEKVNYALVHGNTGYSANFSRYSLRDLVKWCKRIDGLGFALGGDTLSAYECQCIYDEAIDVFAAFSTSVDNIFRIRKAIAKLWAISGLEAEKFYPDVKPIIQETRSSIKIGRVTFDRTVNSIPDQKKHFVEIRRSLHAIERLACSVKYNEPVLLVGETGTGKTTLVQNLAIRLGQRLTVLNLSQQSDVADLLGGFKPLSMHYVCISLYKEFEGLFSKNISMKDNAKFFVRLQKHLMNKKWESLLKDMRRGVDSVKKEIGVAIGGRSSKKRKRPLNEKIFKAWENFSVKLEIACGQVAATSAMLFSFVEGAFVKALRNGEWILLDEVNLAPPEVLQRVAGVLEDDKGSLCLAERGDVSYVFRHPNFRIFACMNPATDAGKRELPHSVRCRFTEYFIDDELDKQDLTLFVNQFVDGAHFKVDQVDKIVHFYQIARKESVERLQDGANQKPQFSLRSLYRALEYTRKAQEITTFKEALYDGFSMFFVTLLDRASAKLMNHMIASYLLGGNLPSRKSFDFYLTGKVDCPSDPFVEDYVLTKTVRQQLGNLARAVYIKRYPVLLQGPTSSGKTSLVRYLAAMTGHDFVRINNHEHTDLQEYLGSYATDASGKLVFNEGALVRAVRSGSWVVLDELNLAPSDVLEALNRLLDDNRELFVPELQENIRAHPNFMLFATQNPPTIYGGRKVLSRAFHNRFVEIHVDDIPEEEISEILEKRCKISASYAKKMVDVMRDLQLHRQNSNVFAGKHGFITPRDLFRWANRVRFFSSSDEVSSKHRYEVLAREGYYLLAERLRDDAEKNVVKEVLRKQFGVALDEEDMYKSDLSARDLASCIRDGGEISDQFRSVVWTKSMWRLYFLVKHCYEMREPVLLVGETGGGKTTVCQLLSVILNSKLHILNCHQYTETSDFIGGFYPVRERSRLILEFENLVGQIMQSKAFTCYPGAVTISPNILQASSTMEQLATMLVNYQRGLVQCQRVNPEDLDTLDQLRKGLEQCNQQWHTIFSWQDGPLVQAMKDGHMFLVDEISLADDSVLERLNSVLEPERTMSLPEKGGSLMEKVTAHENFFILATMNPGGDFGKKELSPALRNRFTEIWVPSLNDLNEVRDIVSQRISKPELLFVVDPIVNFFEEFDRLQTGRLLTVRDIVSWVSFINVTQRNLGGKYAFLHGAFLILLDGLTLGTCISRDEAEEVKVKCLHFLLKQLKVDEISFDFSNFSSMYTYGWGDSGSSKSVLGDLNMHNADKFGLDPFFIERGDNHSETGGFEFLAPTTRKNAFRMLRAMQLRKPVLVEGSPGVGKTSLVVALGRYSGHKVVRINLSEQTDMMDLLGSDLPVDSDEGMKFAWSDGILLQALKEGCWVLLDELNLAPQSVLEGLNAILDHREEVYIPELDLTFKCPPSFRVFACQNPSSQGGGRKNLPKSFLNRFTKVYVDELIEDDYLSICTSLYPSIPRSLLSKLIQFNKRLHEETMLLRNFAQDGSPWEFNLRDVIRSCEIIKDIPEKSRTDCFLHLVYLPRMRTAIDCREVIRLYEQIFQVKLCINPFPRVHLDSRHLIVGNTAIERNCLNASILPKTELKILPGIRQNLEAVANCVKHQWLCILVGPSSSCKTSLIRVLAHLSGNVLNELNLSSATDTSELLGCFEQYSILRNLRSIAAQVEQYVNKYCNLQLGYSVQADGKKKLISRWHEFVAVTAVCDLAGHASLNMGNVKPISSSFGILVDIIEELKVVSKQNMLLLSGKVDYLDDMIGEIQKLEELHLKTPFPARFEWVTGLFLKAIENGEWIVLENANLCNPTVLDRINSLVEPSGSITVSERGAVDGKPLILHPHPNFRVFLTVNPSYGEVSRAMRNRGVEIFMMPPFWLVDDGKGCNIPEMELKDITRFLSESGIPGDNLVDMMAKAHMHAREKGSSLNIRITYFELTRWVQLFQQLLMKGNGPLWSLCISWEHTYLSSFGEGEAVFVRDAVNSFLSENTFMINYPLFMPGGWPMPLNLKDFVLYPKETSIKHNCIYLEFLGARIAYSELQVTRRRFASQSVNTAVTPYLVDAYSLRKILFPTSASEINLPHQHGSSLDLVLAGKMLIFSVAWIIEQATHSDLHLYLLWFNWFSSELLPFCEILNLFLGTLKEEMNHLIWKYILHCGHQMSSLNHIDIEMQHTPLLSYDFADIISSSKVPNVSASRFENAINCIELLRHSHMQWDAERRHNFVLENPRIGDLLNSLRKLEKHVLEMLIDAVPFGVILKLYSDLLQDHVEFWDSILSFDSDKSIISCRSLLKNAKKLHAFYPSAGVIVSELMVCTDVLEISSRHMLSEKPMLWIHGGHPQMPNSSDLYDKQMKILELCESIWPANESLQKKRSRNVIELVSSLNPELRSLATQGICIASYLTKDSTKDQSTVSLQLGEIWEKLSERFEYEKLQLEKPARFQEGADFMMQTAACCVLLPPMLHTDNEFLCWEDTNEINDVTSFFLDSKLIQQLSSFIWVGSGECKQVLKSASDLVEHSLDFSLTSSSRSPHTLSPHRKILWAFDAWMSNDRENVKIQPLLLEMWFFWHCSLWRLYTANHLNHESNNIPFPGIFFQPIWTSIVLKLRKSSREIGDYHCHSLKMRVASSNIWRSSQPELRLFDHLLSTARLLLLQIVYAHEKAFLADDFATIKSLFCVLGHNEMMEEKIQQLSVIISSSSHGGLRHSVQGFIKPAMRELYINCLSGDCHSLGYAWIRIGGLRFHLLVNSDELDPAMKYSYKHSKLTKEITLREVELGVRQQCTYMSGRVSKGQPDEKRLHILEQLKTELSQMEMKIVFRPDPQKFKRLKGELNDFSERINDLLFYIDNREPTEPLQTILRACDWQKTSTSFIEHLTRDYPEYLDIIQPIQVSIYEMKLGLSLILSSTFERDWLCKLAEDRSEKVLETIQTFMRFPKGKQQQKFVDVKSIRQLDGPVYDIEDLPRFTLKDFSLLENLVTSGNSSTDCIFSRLHLRAAFFRNILAQVAHFVADTCLMGNRSFVLLEKIFSDFAIHWMDMKAQAKSKAELASQDFKFRPRGFKIDNVIEVDLSNLGRSLEGESFQEWQKVATEEEDSISVEGDKEEQSLEEVWSSMQSSVLTDIVQIHNRLFGSSNLVIPSGSVRVSDADRLRNFRESYGIGTEIIKDLKIVNVASLDASLLIEHLLDVSSGDEDTSPHGYNFYKDSNSSSMAKMVKPLLILERAVLSLLGQWEDHPGLQRIVDTIRMLLKLPYSTPLAKALSGLQFLFNRVHELRENSPKLSLSSHIEPIYGLVSSWQKMEFESWSILLDEVQDQHEMNAAMLWFPLYSVLHRETSDVSEFDQSAIKSLEEFVQTSNVGEFRRRLQLILAFYGQLSRGILLGVYQSPGYEANLSVLYNVFGFYVQFLPVIHDYIETTRRNINVKLKELMKLCKWERIESYLSMEMSKKMRHKFRKLIRELSDALQQPVKLILNQRAIQSGISSQIMQYPKFLYLFSFDNTKLLNAFSDVSEDDANSHFIWYAHWIEKYVQALDSWKDIHLDQSTLGFQNCEESKSFIRKCSSGQTKYVPHQKEFKDLSFAIRKISRAALDYSEIWKNVTKSIGKRRALSDLLKLLENCGLSRHSSKSVDDQLDFLLQSQYHISHLLLTGGAQSTEAVAGCSLLNSQHLPHNILESDWKTVNEYYFKSILSLQLLQYTSLNFHKDFTLEQVTRAGSFLCHLVVIQQEQRAAIYEFSRHLDFLRGCSSVVQHLYDNSTSECTMARNQHATVLCLWRQKQLFDKLWILLQEELLVLKKVRASHLTSCQDVQNSACNISLFFESYIPVIRQSKDSLDGFLLVHTKAWKSFSPTGADPSKGMEGLVFYPMVVSSDLEGLLFQNFEVLRKFEENLCAFCEKNHDRSFVRLALLENIHDTLKEGLQLNSELGETMDATTSQSSEVEASFNEAFRAVFKQLTHVRGTLCSLCTDGDDGELEGTVSSWKPLFTSRVTDLCLEQLCREIPRAVCSAEKLVSSLVQENSRLSFNVGLKLKKIHEVLDLFLDFGNGFLNDLLAVHKAICVMTHSLGENLAMLFSKGFGVPPEDEVEDGDQHGSQNATGTGMGEGVGTKDVSDQIENEDQLIGDSSKQDDEQKASDEMQEQKEKGIEMEHDFDADMFNLSQESGDDDDNDDDSEDEQLDSAMGKTGDDSEVVDERHWDDEDDNEPENGDEKKESGLSVNDTKESERELRAKEDNAADLEEAERNSKDVDSSGDNGGKDEENTEQVEGSEDMNIDENDQTAPAGTDPRELNQTSEKDDEMDNVENNESMEEAGAEEHDKEIENTVQEDEQTAMDETAEVVPFEQENDITEKEDPDSEGKDQAEVPDENQRTDATESDIRDLASRGNPGFSDEYIPSAASEIPLGAGPSDSMNEMPEANWSNSNSMMNDLASQGNSMSGIQPDTNVLAADFSVAGRFSEHQQKSMSAQEKSSSIQKGQPNPYRSLGDALEGWKERVRVPVDVQEDKKEASGEMNDEDAEEYGFVSELEKGTAQALGPATAEQRGTQPDIDESKISPDEAVNDDDQVKMEIEMQKPEQKPVQSMLTPAQNRREERIMDSNLENRHEETLEEQDQNTSSPDNPPDSIARINKFLPTDDALQFSELSIDIDDLVKSREDTSLSRDEKDKASSLWRKYELITSRSSQELAEQLRLVLMPTLANKLKGDFKTGKRINMKKVIPYIASNYRKDKIWLRRTRPDKRDYQVIIAVDDSRSMSLTGCGDKAIEALVTVCRALSQLEMGNLAVASFGTKGNMKLLHDFDRPFTGEEGIKMISSLTFEQENTIVDEPVVDLLRHLKKLLDVSATRARMPTGQNPLQQLVLIIADGRFHEKEKLRRCVRDFLNSKRMVAFLLLDNPENSITTLQDANFKNGKFEFTKYMDSFPFPYYILLQKNEDLPRTLADLLRQWFELMQQSRD
ncbi:hypothetical protein MLD38_030260 [Melastoma candidum]|uniref:Uncharacterized protein n=1 Tax=Melastoma candidum TaxID=119954 RepID=A0ACB9MMC8_9MYRT|nr:hypothetical protein MLD38_030260 [Melastoma candidum]